LLIYDDVKMVIPATANNVAVYEIQEEYNEVKFLPTFPQFNIPTREEQVNMVVSAVAGKVLDIEHAVRALYQDEMPEEEIVEMVSNIKLENMLPEELQPRATVRAIDTAQLRPLEQMEEQAAVEEGNEETEEVN
jgi:hypothetical protein